MRKQMRTADSRRKNPKTLNCCCPKAYAKHARLYWCFAKQPKRIPASQPSPATLLIAWLPPCARSQGDGRATRPAFKRSQPRPTATTRTMPPIARQESSRRRARIHAVRHRAGQTSTQSVAGIHDARLSRSKRGGNRIGPVRRFWRTLHAPRATPCSPGVCETYR